MKTRLSSLHDHLRNSFWFVPAVMILAAVLVAGFTLSLDDFLTARDLRAVPGLHTVVYSGGPDGAREVLGTVAGSMITVAGVVFSITIVALTLASGQFGPRLMDSFVRDRGNQVTLGTFIATFVYSLLVLRTVRSDQPASVPDVSVTCALLFALAGLAVLIYFIHHVAVGIQAPHLVAAISEELTAGVDSLFPDADAVERARAARSWTQPEGPAAECAARTSGYVQIVDLDRLVAIADRHDLRIELTIRPGRFVVPTTVVARVWPELSADVAAEITRCVVAGARRTPVQDVEFPVRQLAEVAVRSLSPAINDPFTAQTCVEQLSVGLCEIAQRELPADTLAGADGAPRLRVADPVTFPRLVTGAFAQIRQSASFHAPVYLHLLEALARIADCVRESARLDALLAEGWLVLEAARAQVPSPADRETIERAHRELVARSAAADQTEKSRI